MLDVLFRGASLIDGSGEPPRLADVGVRDGMVATIDAPSGVGEPAARTIDATGLVLAPGFIDIHTHYDAQLFWDPAATPSPLHGVTTVFGGNCGFTLAPAGPDHAGYLMRMMARVEGMPLEALEAGLPWDWTGYDDWLGRLEGAIAVNAGFLVGHSALRRVAMGDAATGEVASPAQLETMVSLLRAGLAAGGLGFSTSQAPTHNDPEGQPVPSRWASREEVLTLARAVRDHPGTTISLILAGCLSGFSDEEVDLLTGISLAAGRPVNWNVLGVTAANPDQHRRQLAASDRAAARGATVVALTLPHQMKMRLSFRTGFLLDGLPGWREVMHLPIPERLDALRDPDVRQRLEQGAKSDEAGMLKAVARWDRMVISEVFSKANAQAEGRTVGEVAAERGTDPFTALCEVVVADELRTGLDPQLMVDRAEDFAERAEVWRDPRTVIGGSDAGAHLDMMCGAIATTSLLAEGVREHQAITLQEAVRQLTDVPARLYGLKKRGRLQEGWHADLVLFDPGTVGYQPIRTRFDLPAGAPRLYAEATGIESVWVNGTPIVEDGELTGATPGTLLRSGRDTDTVEVPGERARTAG